MGNALISRRGGAAKAKEPTSWTFLQAISANGNFNAEANTWYRVHVFGKSGNGGSVIPKTSGGGQANTLGGAGGGGAGGYSCSSLYFKDVTSVPVTIGAAASSFGSYLSATAGSNGVNKDLTSENGTTSSSESILPGTAGGNSGTGSGGNIINYSGGIGGTGGAGFNLSGGAGTAGSAGGNSGGNGGALRGSVATKQGGGGGGGGRLKANAYVGAMGVIGAGGDSAYSTRSDSSQSTYVVPGLPGDSPPVWNATNPPTLYGGGGGAGGTYFLNFASILGGTGSPGLIIIEKGV